MRVLSKKQVIGSFVFGLILTSVGYLFLYTMYLGPKKNIKRASTWQKAKCTIEQSKKEKSSKSKARAYIQYSYNYDSKKYLGDTIYFGYMGIEVASLLEDFPKGLKTTCFVNPEKHSESVLMVKQISSIRIAFPAFIIFMGIWQTVWSIKKWETAVDIRTM